MSSPYSRSSINNSPARNVPYNVPNAALRGATLAFAAKPPPVKANPVTQTRYPGINGALSPANVASRASSVSPEGRIGRTQSLLEPEVSSRNSSRSRSAEAEQRNPMFTRSRSDDVTDRGARRGSSLVKVEGLHDKQQAGERAGAQGDAPTDSTPIAPTTSLVRLFEQQSQNTIDNLAPKEAAATSTLEPIKTNAPPILSPKPQRSISVRSVSKELEDPPEITVTKPNLPPPRRTKSTSVASTEPTSSSSPRPYITSPYKDQSLKRITPHITGDSLANAIVGAHLAASRQPTPAKPSPPRPPSPRRKYHQDLPSRSTSPPKRHHPAKLRHTLRHDPSSSSSSESPHRRGVRHMVKKHPHKHHEGTRKRWRDTITERERKRYEGVWAANRGLFTLRSPSSSSDALSVSTGAGQGTGLEDEVLNLVVRDIWARSRLPRDVLQEIWFLVDRKEVGRLSKEEFVVGLWLVDQRLKGRKLPARVSESVWASVTGLGTRGVKVRSLEGKGKKKLERAGEWVY